MPDNQQSGEDVRERHLKLGIVTVNGANRYAKDIDSILYDGVVFARHSALSTVNVEQADLPRAIRVAALAWWAANMPTSHAKSVTIKGDGRVDVHWADAEEVGKYTLPVNFLATPVNVDALREALEFYADRGSWACYKVAYGRKYSHATDDKGEKARAALSTKAPLSMEGLEG